MASPTREAEPAPEVGPDEPIGHPKPVAERQPKAIRVMAGTMLMVAVFLIGASVVLRYAGDWGVPFFGFTSARGSQCENTLTGYVCEPLTLADVEYYADVDLPNNTRVLTGSYRATHDYQLTATLRVPKTHVAPAAAAVVDTFGPCRTDRPAPVGLTGVSGLCVHANDDAITGAGEPASRLWVVGTGLAKDGTRTIAITLRSR